MATLLVESARRPVEPAQTHHVGDFRLRPGLGRLKGPYNKYGFLGFLARPPAAPGPGRPPKAIRRGFGNRVVADAQNLPCRLHPNGPNWERDVERTPKTKPADRRLRQFVDPGGLVRARLWAIRR